MVGGSIPHLSRHTYYVSEDGFETDEIPQDVDIYKDFDAIRKKANISNFKGKFVKRSYVFGEKDVPNGESRWLKVVYPFTGI